MEFLNSWIQFGILLTTLLGGIAACAVVLKKIFLRDLSDYKEDQQKICNLRESELSAIKDANKIMLECHDVTLKSIDDLANGRSANGEILKQRAKLREHIFEKYNN